MGDSITAINLPFIKISIINEYISDDSWHL